MHAVVKVTRDCNLRCKYCYVADKDKYKNEVMPFEVFKDLVDRIVEDRIKNNTNNEDFSFTFHGGEPTIIGYDTLNKYISYAYNTFRANDVRARFSIQTNTTLLDERFINLFRDYQDSVGISYDGIGSNNKDRTNRDSKYYENVIKKLKENQVSVGNICIVDRNNIDNITKNIKYFNKLKLQGKYNYVEDALNIGNCEVSGEEYFHKCIKPMLDMSLRQKTLKIIPDSNVGGIIDRYCSKVLSDVDNLRTNNGGGKSICYSKFCGGGCRILEISPDGSINSCGRYDKDSENSNVGTIYSKDFLGLKKRIKFYDLVFKKHIAILNHNCDLCEAQDICDFGCIVFSFVKNHKWDIDENLSCSYFLNLKKYIYENINGLLTCYIHDILKYNNGYLQLKRSVDNRLISKINKMLSDIGMKNVVAIEDENWKGDKRSCCQVKLLKK